LEKLAAEFTRTSLALYSFVKLNKVSSSACAASLVAAAFCSTGCGERGAKPDSLTVAQLASLMDGGDPPKLYDANGNQTRKEYGVIPGATLLPGSRDYAITLLPGSRAKHVVFYCASSWCGASEMAAERAIREGYTKVSVLPDGIKGWAEAGLQTQKIN
jgi:rhodanese-related sulfurtransferase